MARPPALPTALVHPHLLEDGAEGQEPSAGLSPLLDRSATFRLDAHAAEALATGVGADRHDVYGRYGSRTIREVGRLLAAVEGAGAALPFASGSAASATVLAEWLPPGAVIAAANELYGGTEVLLRTEVAARGGHVVRFDAADPASLERLVASSAPPALVWCEAIANPLLGVADLAGLGGVCGAAKLPWVVDATFSAGMACRPLERGATLVVHSATKFLNGHSDVVAGVVCGSHDAIGRLWRRMIALGGCLDPGAAWLVARGVRTLPLRWERQATTAALLADRLAEHPAVRRVLYPGRPDHPHHELARRDLRSAGAMVSFEVADGEAATAVLSRVRVCSHATSLGGIETLLSSPARSSHASLAADERARRGITDGLLRLSVGIEDPEDLWDDLAQALRSS